MKVNAEIMNALMKKVHGRIDSGLDIQTFADGSAEVRWRRKYKRHGLSDERFARGDDLYAALEEVLRYENAADAHDADMDRHEQIDQINREAGD